MGLIRGGRVSRIVVLALVFVGGCVSSSPDEEATTGVRSALGTFPGVLTQHNDLGRTGANLNETILNVSNVKPGTFGKLHTLPVSGQVYAQPLYVPAAINNKNVLIIATEANKVYAYNADSPWDLLWSRTDFEMPWSSTACGNTQPMLGISSTPVIDPASSTIYVAAKTNDGGVFKYMLHSLNLVTGADRGAAIDMSKDIHGATITVPGTGDGTSGTTVAFDPMRQLNRVALTLSQGVLSVGFASHCDQGNYHGWILRFNTTVSPPAPLAPFVTNPNTGHGGLWMGGAGFTVDANNDLYFVSGDGKTGLTNTNGTQLANAFVRLTTVGVAQTPTVGTWFMPSDVAQLDKDDKDIGSAGALLIPGTSRIVGGGKNGIFYVLNTATMGGFQAATPPDPQIVQRFAPTATGNWIVGSPIFWDSPAGPRVYVWPGKTPLEVYPFDRTLGKFSQTTPLQMSSDNPQNDPQGGHLSLSANGSTAGTGIVWANHGIDNPGGGAAVAGAVYAFNAENLQNKLWDSMQVASDALPSYAKYTPPTVANGKVYVGTFSDAVVVYGLLTKPVDAGAPRDATDVAAPLALSCGGFDGGAPQPTTWSYVYNTYFAVGTVGHCATCHGAVAQGGFLSGMTQDSFYTGLVNVGQITPAAGSNSPIGNPAGSALSWFGPTRGLPSGINNFMPLNQQVLNPQAVAAICGWVAAGALDDQANGLACSTGAQCTSGFCVDGFCCNTGCTAACNACSGAKTGAANGTCATMTAGAADARCATGTLCGNTGLCAAGGLCQQTPPTTSCRAASCTGTTATAAATCTGTGTCPTVVTTMCAPFACGATACKTSCAADTDCIGGDICSGTTCVAKRANGGTCTAANQCVSGSCVDGFCCNTACTASCNACSNAKTGAANGTCAASTVGASDARCTIGAVCGNTGLCAAGGVCQQALATTSCRAASCAAGTATAPASCSGSGSCPTVVTTMCAPFVCGATACKTSCAADADCITGDFCSGTTCVAKKANGSTCTAVNQCVSGSCVDGFCCNTACAASCNACSNAKTGDANGTCAAATVGVADARCTIGAVCGNTGLCAAGGLCQQAPPTTSCRAASCASGTLTAAASCNGAGVCPTAVTSTCAPFICGTATACATTCTTAANCAAGDQCTGGVCVGCAGGTCKANGAACAAANECGSNACVDGFCCNTACTASCNACSNAKTGAANGTCAPSTAGAVDARCAIGAVCGNTGLCAAGGLCQQAAATTSCRTASCTAGTATTAASCTGNGVCPTMVTTSCAPFVCGTTACKTSCAADTDCITGDFCSGMTCVAKKASGGTCTAASQCASGSCVDGFCCNSACTASCNACSNAKTGAANGTCAATTAGAVDARCVIAAVCGNTGLCAAGGLCQQAAATTSCRAASCAGGTATAAASCTGSGSCPTMVTTSCAPFVCGTTACKTTCAADTDCITGDVCSAGACVGQKANGGTCTAATQCASGSCVDGFCCNTACAASCNACSNAKTGAANGTCAAATAGAADARCTIGAVCGNTGLCAAGGLCQQALVTTSCRAASCTGGTATAAAHCDGAGSCPAATTAACTPYICGATACKTSCTVSTDCATGLTCTGGVCVSTAVCSAAIAVIDDLEDDNNQVRLLDGRSGPLYTYADTVGSTITPAAGSIFAPAAGGNGGSAFAAHFSGQLSTAATVWAGMGMDFLAPKALYNGSKYTGISFFAKKGSAAASGAVRFKVPDRNTDPTGGVCTTCANDFGTDLTLTTAWTKFTIPFSTMTQQAGWGAPRPAQIDRTGIVAVQFQVTVPGSAYDIWVDDVTFTCN